jgi:hypothetical protein
MYLGEMASGVEVLFELCFQVLLLLDVGGCYCG